MKLPGGRAPTFIALLLLIVVTVLAQEPEVHYDPNMILDAVPEECRAQCTPISQTFKACPDTDCLCTSGNNQVLFLCINCLYFDEPGAQTYEVAQHTLKEFSVVCIDYHLAAMSISTTSTRPPSSQTPSSRPVPSSATPSPSSPASNTPSSNPPPSQSSTIISSQPTQSTTLTGAITAPRITSSSASSSNFPSAATSNTSPATTSAFPQASPQQCHLVFSRKQRILPRRFKRPY